MSSFAVSKVHLLQRLLFIFSFLFKKLGMLLLYGNVYHLVSNLNSKVNIFNVMRLSLILKVYIFVTWNIK